MSQLFEFDSFEPTPAAAQARLAAVRPAAYARTRNALDGAVTRLSPYLTHGLLTLPDVLQGLLQRGPLPVQHKLVYELGWREYFRHVWQHQGEGIFASLHDGVLPEAAYARELPPDIRAGRTGLPVIDRAVRELYATGYLHNHARMWLASYVVHLRKVHWRAGADWLYGHLLDGDLASNHLSWQWVAGTGSHKPYLFNADNVARYAPAPWHSPGSVIDTDYGTLDELARRAEALPAGLAAGGAEPPLQATPPPGLFGPPDASAAAGQPVWLVHAWALAEPPPGRLRVGVLDADFHARWPWSAARWRFVTTRMQACCDLLWWGSASQIAAALRAAASVNGVCDAHLARDWQLLALAPAAQLFRPPARHCTSFSQFWTRATKGVIQAAELVGLDGN